MKLKTAFIIRHMCRTHKFDERGSFELCFVDFRQALHKWKVHCLYLIELCEQLENHGVDDVTDFQVLLSSATNGIRDMDGLAHQVYHMLDYLEGCIKGGD